VAFHVPETREGMEEDMARLQELVAGAAR
jgi:hypothetical protein